MRYDAHPFTQRGSTSVDTDGASCLFHFIETMQPESVSLWLRPTVEDPRQGADRRYLPPSQSGVGRQTLEDSCTGADSDGQQLTGGGQTAGEPT
jgi:hypothetical protein